MGDRIRNDPVPHPAVDELDGEIGPKDLQRFVTVLRGYDRIEVDECLGRIAVSVGVLRAELAAQRGALDGMQAQTVSGSAARRPDSDGGFGVRAERLLRLAEAEAREMRGGAAQEASALVEHARADAERIRHDMERALIERSSAQDQEHAKRMSDLQQREEQIAQQAGEISRKTDEARAAVRRDIDAMREQAQAELAETRALAAAEIARGEAEARNEVVRLEKISAAARGELQRLVGVLVEQLGEDRRNEATQRAGTGTGQSPVPDGGSTTT